MTADDSFDQLKEKLRNGSDSAANDLFDRYARRLIGLARRRLDDRLRSKVDADDIVQSVFRSFFGRNAKEQFQLEGWGSLWGCCAQITIRKCIRQADRFQAKRRNIERECSARDSEFAEQILARGPTPEDAAVLSETLDVLLRPLDDRARQIVSLGLVGHTTEEISCQLGCSRRTVQRELLIVRRRLEEMQNVPPDRAAGIDDA